MENPVSSNVPEALKKNLDWYISHQQELAKNHDGKILLIVDQHLIEAFHNMADAYNFASAKYQPGTFTLQPCSPDADSYTLMLYSPIYSALA